MRHFHFSCIGESHKSSAKPCQDASDSLVEDKVSIAVVCDGHGGDRYFRSDVGSRFCAEITVRAVKDFVRNIDKCLLAGKPFTQGKAVADKDVSEKMNETDMAFRQLFASIITKWNEKIEQYTGQNPLTETEREKVDAKYQEAFERKESLEKVYGCTLMAYVQAKEYWFAFHIGDGKCVSFHKEGELWREPVPWDDRCFLNKTTSICDSDALNEFRYCYEGDKHFPVAVFLGSDGMDDSFGLMENLVDFYIQVSKLLASADQDAAHKDIEEILPELSRRGSQDDMSIACIYDEKCLPDVIPHMIEHQIQQIEHAIAEAQSKVAQEELTIQRLSGATKVKEAVELDYAKKNKARQQALIDTLHKKKEQRESELTTLRHNPTP